MAEGARLESVFRGNSNVGSNPTLSARFSMTYRYHLPFHLPFSASPATLRLATAISSVTMRIKPCPVAVPHCVRAQLAYSRVRCCLLKRSPYTRV